MKINRLIYLSFLLLLSCGDFKSDINVSPSNVSKPYTNGLLTGFLRTSIFQDEIQGLYVQHFSQVQYTTGSRYTTKQFRFLPYYLRLTELQKIIDLNTDDKTKDLDYVKAGGDTENQIAVAEILKSFFFLKITDYWGPAPYSEALKGLKKPFPKYDSQKDIYTLALNTLKTQAGKLKTDGELKGDILFNGDLKKWKLFAHCVRVIAALRISDVDEAKAKEVLSESMKEAEKITETINFKFIDETGNKNPWYSEYLTRQDIALSDIFINKMKSLSDPRLAAYADKPKSGGDYNGMKYGVKSPSVNDNDLSLVGSSIRKANSPFPIITKAQILFAKAEAIHRGLIAGSDGDASTNYLNAIKASFEQWGVYDVDSYSKYISNASVAWDKDKWKERLGLQKWLSLYFQGGEAWCEWRRLNYPKLSPPDDDLNQDGGIPVRHGYPATEVNLNTENYNEGVKLLGGADHLSTRVWWDKDENDGEK